MVKPTVLVSVKELLGAEEELEDAALHHRLGLVHGRALRHHLPTSKTKGCQWVLQQLEVKQLLRGDTEATERGEVKSRRMCRCLSAGARWQET